MITKKTFVVFVSFVANVCVALWLVAAGLLAPAEASSPVQATPSVRWTGRLVVALNRRVEGGAEDGDRRATLHELTAAAPSARPLLSGEIAADYQLSPDATQIAFRPAEGRDGSRFLTATWILRPFSTDGAWTVRRCG
jgi:hypothetical protein